MAVQDLEVSYHRPDDLTPYPQNSRVHSDEQIAQLVGSLQEFGFTRPIVIDERGVILAGNGIFEAAKLAGIEQIPVVTKTGLTDSQKRAYVIADNKLGLNSRFDQDVLEREVRALAEAGDLDLDLLGFTEQEIERMLREADPGDGSGEGEGGGDPIIQYNIVFDDEPQQALWYKFMRHVRGQYEADTFAEALTAWLEHNVEFD